MINLELVQWKFGENEIVIKIWAAISVCDYFIGKRYYLACKSNF